MQASRDTRLLRPDTVAPKDRAVLDELLRVRDAEDMELFRRLPEQYPRDHAWVLLSRGFAHMTEEGLAEFFEAYIKLLHEHGHRREDAPPGSRPVNIRLFTIPAGED